MRALPALARVVLAVALVAACSGDDDDGEGEGGGDPAVAGALVSTTARSTVGVVLDEIPESMRGRVVDALVAQSGTFWTERAHAQLGLMRHRLDQRADFYDEPKGQLPLPPEDVWRIELTSEPERRSVQGHDVVAVDYDFTSTLVSDVESTAASEPALAEVGGRWAESFNLPIDPELLFQRTGYACMNESDHPFHSVDSEEPDSFYDQEAEVEDSLGNVDQAHYTRQPEESCLEALEAHVGRIDTEVVFQRLAWDVLTADEFRFGTVTGDAPDLAVHQPLLAPSRVTYRYVHTDSCDVAEEAVGGTGWRRLLQFATADENVGNRPLVIGGLDHLAQGDPQALDTHHLFEFSPCHRHHHFRFYGDFAWEGGGEVVNAKKAFCLRSTSRAANRESSPLFNDFGTCLYQGVAPGWLDEYHAGLPGQWLDTTDFPEGTGERTFRSNPDGFLCEGAFVDADGEPLEAEQEPVWEPTDLTTEDGEVVERQRCELAAGWDDNNVASVTETVLPHGEGLITEPCTRGQIGPLRNCGFSPTATIGSCAAGQPASATFTIPTGAAPQVVRLTEFSLVLNSPVPARYEDSWVPLEPGISDLPAMLATGIVTPEAPLTLAFTCPPPRTGGAPEPGGAYSMYTGPVFPGDAAVAVSAG